LGRLSRSTTSEQSAKRALLGSGDCRTPEENNMARKTVLVSDLSGAEIAEGKGALTIRFNDARKGTLVLDVTDNEAEQMGAKGRRQARRGRKPKA
jgi:hypothetical protein